MSGSARSPRMVTPNPRLPPSAFGSRHPTRWDKSHHQSPEELAGKVRDLEKHRQEDEKERRRQELQRKKELVMAKRNVQKEIQEATRLLRKNQMEVNKVTQTLNRIEQQEDQVMVRKTRQAKMFDDETHKVRSKHHELETSLQQKMVSVGEARGRLAHAELAAKLLEMGVVLAKVVDGPPAAAGASADNSAPEGHAAGKAPPALEEDCPGVEDARASETAPKDSEKLRGENLRLLRENEELRERLQLLEDALVSETTQRSASLPPERTAHSEQQQQQQQLQQQQQVASMSNSLRSIPTGSGSVLVSCYNTGNAMAMPRGSVPLAGNVLPPQPATLSRSQGASASGVAHTPSTSAASRMTSGITTPTIRSSTPREGSGSHHNGSALASSTSATSPVVRAVSAVQPWTPPLTPSWRAVGSMRIAAASSFGQMPTLNTEPVTATVATSLQTRKAVVDTVTAGPLQVRAGLTEPITGGSVQILQQTRAASPLSSRSPVVHHHQSWQQFPRNAPKQLGELPKLGERLFSEVPRPLAPRMSSVVIGQRRP